MKDFFVRNARFLIALLVFLALGAAAYYLNINEDGKPTWVWGTLVMFTAIPIEVAIFEYLRQSFLQHLAGALVLAALLTLCNFLQLGTLTWSLLLAPACLLWPIAYGVWALMNRLTKSRLLAALIGWIVVSGIAIAAEWLVTKRLAWSLPLTVFLAFWPAASLAFAPDTPPPPAKYIHVIDGRQHHDALDEQKEEK